MHKPKYRLHINLKQPLRQSLPGDWTGGARGKGYEFWQLKEYQKGDDVSLIDWKARARSRKLHVREFLRETFYNLMIFCDISSSMFFGKKLELMQDIGTSLAYAALKDNNSCGLVLFANNIVKYLPPNAKHNQYARITNEMHKASEAKKGKTSLQAAFKHLNTIVPGSFAIFLSDFIIDPRESKLLSRSMQGSGRSGHEIACIHILEDVEYNFPRDLDTIISVRDNESGKNMDLDPAKARDGALHARYEDSKRQLAKLGMDSVLIRTSDHNVEQSINSFLSKRSQVAR